MKRLMFQSPPVGRFVLTHQEENIVKTSRSPRSRTLTELIDFVH
jgi:hypothetical protein